MDLSGDVLNVLLVDDDVHAREALRAALSAFPCVAVAGEAADGQEAMALLAQTAIDLAFLDIDLGAFNGFHLAQHIQLVYPRTKIIFLTGHTDFALKGYDYAPVDFLIKPVNMLRLERALDRVQKQRAGEDAIPRSDDARVGVHVDGRLELIRVRDISYMEKTRRKVLIRCSDGKQYCTSDPLQRLQTIFEPHGFFRCHQSFLVSLDKVQSIRHDELNTSQFLCLEGADDLVPLSRDKKSELYELLTQRGVTIF